MVAEKSPVSRGPITPDPAAPDAEPPLLELSAVGFGYAAGAPVLEDVTLAVGPGQTLALLGANGAGKSTVLRQAIGLLRPERGAVQLAGQPAAGRTTAELARAAGLLFQDPAAMLFADTVAEECAFAPRNQGLPRAAVEERVAAALALLDLDELRGEAPGTLSLGQRKRVGLACLAAQGVRVWLLDEPTAGLDPGGVAEFLRALGEGAGARDAVLLATHDLDLALLHADRVAVLDGGRIARVGPPGEVLLDAELLARARLRPTSLLEANRGRLQAGLPALDARALARGGPPASAAPPEASP